MKWLKTKTNLQFTGFYLGGGSGSGQAPYHEDNSWMASRQTLKDMGWGMAPIYLGRQQEFGDRSSMTNAQGVSDGQAAAKLMVQAGFAYGSVVYLDIENGQPPSPELIDYYQGWNNGVIVAGYTPGVYCSYLLADRLRLADSRPLFWVFKIAPGNSGCFDPLNTQFPISHPADSGIPYATVWQLHSQNCPQWMSDSPYNSKTVSRIDYDVSSIPDPSTADPRTITPTALFPLNWQAVFGGQITLNWSSHSLAITYRVTALYWNGSTWIQLGTYNGTQNRLTLSGFPSFTYPAYLAWNVMACNGWGCSPASPWQYGTYWQ
jgi:hypothetical protein